MCVGDSGISVIMIKDFKPQHVSNHSSIDTFMFLLIYEFIINLLESEMSQT